MKVEIYARIFPWNLFGVLNLTRNSTHPWPVQGFLDVLFVWMQSNFSLHKCDLVIFLNATAPFAKATADCSSKFPNFQEHIFEMLRGYCESGEGKSWPGPLCDTGTGKRDEAFILVCANRGEAGHEREVCFGLPLETLPSVGDIGNPRCSEYWAIKEARFCCYITSATLLPCLRENIHPKLNVEMFGFFQSQDTYGHHISSYYYPRIWYFFLEFLLLKIQYSV